MFADEPAKLDLLLILLIALNKMNLLSQLNLVFVCHMDSVILRGKPDSCQREEEILKCDFVAKELR